MCIITIINSNTIKISFPSTIITIYPSIQRPHDIGLRTLFRKIVPINIATNYTTNLKLWNKNVRQVLLNTDLIDTNITSCLFTLRITFDFEYSDIWLNNNSLQTNITLIGDLYLDVFDVKSLIPKNNIYIGESNLVNGLGPNNTDFAQFDTWNKEIGQWTIL